MAEERITLDQKAFKALAVDTRVKILKLLTERQHTATELSADLSLRNSTIKEHLDNLVEAGLIKVKDDGRKWKYYHLTLKGRQIVQPTEVKVMFAFGLFALAAVVSALLYVQNFILNPFASIQHTSGALSKTQAPESISFAVQEAAVDDAVQRSVDVASVSPELVVMLACIVLATFCLLFIFRKKFMRGKK